MPPGEQNAKASTATKARTARAEFSDAHRGERMARARAHDRLLRESTLLSEGGRPAMQF